MVKLLLILLVYIGFNNVAYSHPGNTSSDGCHYCRTNCNKWGYTYGTRHCHNGGVPQFGPADPLYYNYRNTYKAKRTGATGQELCNSKYPGTKFNLIDDNCECSNGIEWSKKFNCNTGFCYYNNGTKAKIGEVSIEDWICSYDGNWVEPESKQELCAIKYPGTSYNIIDDKCKCTNGEDYDEINKKCPSKKRNHYSDFSDNFFWFIIIGGFIGLIFYKSKR
ncbi:MAG: hypothetical protein PHF46_03670 [Candidatus Gracilibacteria bacterium]|nr:hypothetical protein [Candidatus Gracilibacteria bacterium]